MPVDCLNNVIFYQSLRVIAPNFKIIKDDLLSWHICMYLMQFIQAIYRKKSHMVADLIFRYLIKEIDERIKLIALTQLKSNRTYMRIKKYF